jgi:hypothetical protein
VLSFREIIDQDLLSKGSSVFSTLKPLAMNAAQSSMGNRKIRQRSKKREDEEVVLTQQTIVHQQKEKADNEGMMAYLCLLNTNYSFRLKTVALFEPGQPTVCFDIFIVENDMRFKEYRLFENLWRETLLLNHLRTEPEKVAPVISFGQLPGNVIYREVKEVTGITLQTYI